jgi:hypothetical protein
MPQGFPRQHVAHYEGEQGKSEHEPDPEPARDIDQLGIGPLLRGDRHRLQRHAADRTATRLVANNLRVHRAGPLGARTDRNRRDRFQRHATVGAATRSALANLGVHRAGIDAVVGCRRLALSRAGVTSRVGDELLAAVWTAEPVCLSGVFGASARRLSRVYVHTADRIRGHYRRRHGVMGVRLLAVATHASLPKALRASRAICRTHHRAYGAASNRPSRRPRRHGGRL